MVDLNSSQHIFILSPRLRNRNVLLAEYMQRPNTYLYRLVQTDKDLSTFLDALLRDLAKITSVSIPAHHSIAQLAQAFGDTLREAGFTTIILDELDRLETTPQTIEFFEHLVHALPTSILLILNARHLSHQPWKRMVEAGTAMMLGERGGTWPTIEISALGVGTVHVNGLPVDTWDGPLPRNLFYYLVDHPLVTRDEIFDTFWPDLTPKDATNVFHVTKRKISERVGCDITTYSGGFYRLSPNIRIAYDVAHFEEKYAWAEEHGHRSAWEEVVHLYRSEFLHGFTMPWMRERREALREKYANALVALARLLEGKPSVLLLLRALREMPLREDIYRDVMTLYLQHGEPEQARWLYDQLVARLDRTLKIKPSPMTTALYQQVSSQV